MVLQVRFSRAGIRAEATAPPVEGKGNLITGIRAMRLRWMRKRLLAVRAHSIPISTSGSGQNINLEDDALRLPFHLGEEDDDAMNPKYILLAAAACWIAIFLIIAVIWLIRIYFFISHA
jgi:hypothetical protein